MPRIHVCSLARVPETVAVTGARSLITLINGGTLVVPPVAISPDRHLFVDVSDITTPLEGHVLPVETHVADLLSFVRRWDRRDPLVIHCFAGVSRSTAAAFITACALEPEVSEMDFALAIRAASPTATPNSRLVALGDEMLGRAGRMIDAAQSIGRGLDCFEGVPFSLDLRRSR